VCDARRKPPRDHNLSLDGYTKNMKIRQEIPSDREAIWYLTKAAFEGRPYAAGDEQDLIDKLRVCGALTVSLVAVVDSEIVGQISFSPASISSGEGIWFALGPVSVAPKFQGRGIGSALIDAGMKEIEKFGAWGCILTGDPKFYARFGFVLSPDHCPLNEPQEYFMLRLMRENSPVGTFSFHKAFYPGN